MTLDVGGGAVFDPKGISFSQVVQIYQVMFDFKNESASPNILWGADSKICDNRAFLFYNSDPWDGAFCDPPKGIIFLYI